jgi:hypothetical protein
MEARFLTDGEGSIIKREVRTVSFSVLLHSKMAKAIEFQES